MSIMLCIQQYCIRNNVRTSMPMKHASDSCLSIAAIVKLQGREFDLYKVNTSMKSNKESMLFCLCCKALYWKSHHHFSEIQCSNLSLIMNI